MRAHGARVARRSGRRRSSWTPRDGARAAGRAATTMERRRWRRPWLGSARGRSWRGEGASGGFGGERGVDPHRYPGEWSGEAANRCVAPMRCSPSSTCLPAWPASSSLARRWAGPAGGPGCRRQVSPSFLFFFFFYFSATLWSFLKILKQFQNSPNCSWSIVGIFPT